MMKFSISLRGSSDPIAFCCFLVMAALGMFSLSATAQDEPATGAVTLQSQEFAKLPYQQLVKIARNNSSNLAAEEQATASKEGDSKSEGDSSSKKTPAMMLKVSSSRGVPADQIQLTIMRASGPVSIPIQANGDFEVPWSEEIFDENPMVVSNQPKGTMNLGFTIVVKEMRPKVVDGKVAYQDLFKQLLEAQKAMRSTNPDFGKAGNDTFAIQVVGAGKGVSIERNLGTRTIEPDADGNVWLVYDLLLSEENPKVTLPEKAQVNIVPVSAQDALLIRSR